MAPSIYGLFPTRAAVRVAKPAGRSTLPLDRLHQLECRACPLNTAHNVTPKMDATGTKHPLLYVLGEAPGRTEDETPAEQVPKFGKFRIRQFLGKAGQRLRGEIPPEYRPLIRWNNVIQDRPPANRMPAPIELECCRPRVERDIIATKPKAVLALGGAPAAWFGATGGINLWRGRRFPFALGGHSFWVYPTYHPSFVLRAENAQRGDGGTKGDREKADLWPADLARMFESLENLPVPEVLTESDLLKDVRYFLGGGNEALAQLRIALDQLDLTAVALDVETKTLRPYGRESKLLSLSFSDGRRTVAIGYAHPGAKWESLALLAEVIQEFIYKPKTLIAHRALFDAEWIVDLLFLGDGENVLFRRWDDTMAQAYVLDGNKGALSLDVRCLLTFGLRVKGLSNVDKSKLAQFPLPTVLRYNALDAETTARLHHRQKAQLLAAGQWKVYRFHMERLPALVLAQRRGVEVDQTKVEEFRADFAAKIAAKEKEIALDENVRIYSKTHGTLNSNSPKQLVTLFRDQMHRPEGQQKEGDGRKPQISKGGQKPMMGGEGKTSAGGYTTNEAALTQMAKNGVVLATKILDLRGLIKLKGTYLDPLAPGGHLLYPDGALHTTYSDTGTDTARLASDDPNLQNFPSRDFKYIRNVVRARKERVLLASDYGQIEYRIIALMSQDKVILKALDERYDVHMDWAKRIGTDIPSLLRKHDGNLKSLRAVIKNLFVFPAFYLAGESSIAKYLEVSYEQIKPIFKLFWKEFSGVKEWQLRQVNFYKEHGYVESMTGRRRYAPLSMSMIVNTPVQSSASDIVVDAMARLCQRAHEEENDNLLARLNIHDDLTLEPEKKELEATIEQVVPMLLQTPFPWVTVPMSIEMAVGTHWGALRPVGTFFSDEL